MLSVGTVPRRPQECVPSVRKGTSHLKRPPWAVFMSVHMEEEGIGYKYHYNHNNHYYCKCNNSGCV